MYIIISIILFSNVTQVLLLHWPLACTLEIRQFQMRMFEATSFNRLRKPQSLQSTHLDEDLVEMGINYIIIKIHVYDNV